MDKPAEESRLDLDNRKLIFAFVLLICICAGFYVFGFVEGKRQAQRLGEQKVNAGLPAPAPGQGAPAPSETKTQSAKSAAPPTEDKAVKEQLDWYKKVHSRGELSPKDLMEDKKTAARTRAGAARKSAQPSHTSGYSVQIGAFKHKREAEAKAAILKAKRYDYVIQPPGADRELYLLKVGRFESRAQAYAMQQKLKKDGFSSFIKTN
jgi:cell division protein FtsN